MVVVDMQDCFLKNVNSAVQKELFNNQGMVLDWCYEEHIPVIFLEYSDKQVSRGKTSSLLSTRVDGKQTHVILKDSNSGFVNTHLDTVLRQHKVNQIIIMGINANGCVQDTAIGALRRKFQVITASGIIVNSYTLDMKLTPNNKSWYLKNTRFFDTAEDLIKAYK